MAATFDVATTTGHPDSDPAWAGAAAEDWGATMRAVYQEHRNLLVGFFVHRVGDRAMAEDLAHDTIVRFAGAVERFDWDRPVVPYLMAIANNLLIDHQRRDRRQVIVDSSDEWFERLEPGPDLDETVVLGEMLDEAIGRLSERQRIAVELRCRRGWSVPEAAEFLGIAPGTFNQLLFRARENLRTRLDEVGARARGFVLPALVALRFRLRSASDRVREAVPTPSAALGTEALASMVIATTVGVVVAVGGSASGAAADRPMVSISGSDLAEHEVMVSSVPAPAPGASSAIQSAPPVQPTSTEVVTTTAEPTPAAQRTTVIEAPKAIPDSDGQIAVGEDEEFFVVSSQVEARTGVESVRDDGDIIAVHCESAPGEIVCAERAEGEP